MNLSLHACYDAWARSVINDCRFHYCRVPCFQYLHRKQAHYLTILSYIADNSQHNESALIRVRLLPLPQPMSASLSLRWPEGHRKGPSELRSKSGRADYVSAAMTVGFTSSITNINAMD